MRIGNAEFVESNEVMKMRAGTLYVVIWKYGSNTGSMARLWVYRFRLESGVLG